MSRIDPYNNAPPPRPGGGSCGKSTGTQEQYTGPPVLSGLQQMPQQAPQMPPQQAHQQVPQQAPQMPQQVPQYTGRTTEMSQRPMQTPDLQPENQMLKRDLQMAVQYIHQLGGKWPPQ